MDALETKVRDAIAGVTSSKGDDISLDATFEELGIDSLNGFNLLVELEEELGVTFPDDEARALTRVRDVVETLRLLLAQKNT